MATKKRAGQKLGGKKPDVKRVNLKSLFRSLQKELEESLQTAQAHIPHGGTQGGVTELHWTTMLRTHLPARYCVDTAFAVDSTGRLSQQLDLVIYDKQYSPVVFRRDGALYIPAESIYAVFEIKPSMSRRYLGYAKEKAASVRRLKRTSVPITSAIQTAPHAAQLPKPILAGILAHRTSWKNGFSKDFAKLIMTTDLDERLDLGCSLQAGAFNVEYAGGGASVTSSPADDALVSFFLTLLHRLQPLGTVTAIDLTAYGQFTLGKKHGT